MAFYVGDIPAEDIVIEPARGEEPIELAPFDTVDVIFRNFDGTEVETSGFAGSIAGDEVVVEWPNDTPFEDAGLYSVNVILSSSTTNVRERLAPIYVIAQEEDGWHTLDSARSDWADAPRDDFRLFTILTIAKTDVLTEGTSVPAGIARTMAQRQAQLLQARGIWTAGTKNGSGGIDEDNFTITVFPMDWAVKQILRPFSPIPTVANA